MFRLYVAIIVFCMASGVGANYEFETIQHPDVEVLALTASNDFEDYAGYAQRVAGGKTLGFTLIDGKFQLHDATFENAAYFYALGNDGRAAGHFEGADGVNRGLILRDGNFYVYRFPGAVETFILGISDATGAFTGNFIDESGVRRGFSGDEVIEFPGAKETFADFVNAHGILVGSYIDANGIFRGYGRFPNGVFATLVLTDVESDVEYFYIHGINDAAGFVVVRLKFRNNVPRTFVGSLVALLNTVEAAESLEATTINGTPVTLLKLDWATFLTVLPEMVVPGSVRTEGWNINQDVSVVGHYETADGAIHGFIARPLVATSVASEHKLATVWGAIKTR